MKKYGCCKPVLWKHEDGWDVYAQEDCALIGTKWIPKWFDAPLVEDAQTKADAVREVADWHLLGVCLVRND